MVVEAEEDETGTEVSFEEDVVRIKLELDLDDVIFEDDVRVEIILVDVRVDVFDVDFDTSWTLLGAHVNAFPVTGVHWDRMPYEYCTFPPDLRGEEEYFAS